MLPSFPHASSPSPDTATSCPTAKPTCTVPTSTLVPTLPSVDLPNTVLVIGIPVTVVIILALAALWVFLACKARKQRRKRKATDEEAKGKGPLSLLQHSKDPMADGITCCWLRGRTLLLRAVPLYQQSAPWAPQIILGSQAP